MRPEEICVGGWYNRADYKQDELAEILAKNLLDIYISPLAAQRVLDKAISILQSKELNDEYWVDVPDYEGLYSISNKGRIKSISRIKNGGTRFEYKSRECLLKPSITKDGYLTVYLCKNGIRKAHAIHRLVAIAFIDNNNELSDVNHKDENKLNNCVENLEWCSKAYNIKYGTRTQRVSKRISQYSKDGALLNTFNSVKEASRLTGIGTSNIHNSAINKTVVKNGKEYICRSAGGFIWKYLDKEIVL